MNTDQSRMTIDQILAAVQAAGWNAEIFDSRVTSKTTGESVRWVVGKAGRYVCTAQPAVNGPDYHPPIVGRGMTFAVSHLDSEYHNYIRFESITRPPTPAQVETVCGFVS